MHQKHNKYITALITELFVVFPFFHQVVKTNQFSVTRHEKVANGLIGDQGLPGVFVLYELSPMMVKFTEKHRQVVTVAFIIDDRFSNTMISFYIVSVPLQ